MTSEPATAAFRRWWEIEGAHAAAIYGEHRGKTPRLYSLAMLAFQHGWQMRGDAEELPRTIDRQEP